MHPDPNPGPSYWTPAPKPHVSGPILNVGQLRELLAPLADECPLTFLIEAAFTLDLENGSHLRLREMR